MENEKSESSESFESSEYKKSNSYIDTALDATILYQPGFEDMNNDLYKKTNKWGTTHLDQSGICKTAEEAEAEYYGYDYVTSDVAIGLKKKIKNKAMTEKYPYETGKIKITGTPDKNGQPKAPFTIMKVMSKVIPE